MGAMQEADKLRQEAKDILNSILGNMMHLPKDTSVSGVDRLVDCIIGAAIIETSTLIVNATTQVIKETDQERN